MKNKLIRLSCIGLTMCMLATNVLPVPTAYAAEVFPGELGEMLSETEAPGAEPTETPAETEVPGAEPTETPAETEVPETEPTETPAEAEVPGAEPIETPMETQIPDAEPSVTPSATPAAELLQEEAEPEKPGDDEDAAFKEELLAKVRMQYPGMYLNEEGFFEYVDENGTKHIFDPYDPEFAKYMLGEGLVTDEEAFEIVTGGESAESATGTSVSPFTGKTYTHESHVANKVIRHGIDVSKYQGNVNWSKAKADGVEFAIVRVGYRGYGAAGNIASDNYAVQNIKNAHNAGVKVGIYFFSQAITEAEAEEEALYCYNFLKNNSLQSYIDLPVFIDYEYSPTGTSGRLYDAKLSDAERQAICDRFGEVIKGYGYEPGIYANYAMLTDDMQPTKSASYADMNYWIARYNTATKYANRYCFWQYSSQGKVDGITVNTVDCNFWYDQQKNLNESSVKISLSDASDYISDVKELLLIRDAERNYTLEEGTDYTVTVSSAVKDGVTVVTLTMTGMGVYEGTVSRTVTVKQAALSGEMVSDIPAQVFTGKEITIETGLPIAVHHGDEQLEVNKDYTISYKNNIHAGTATVVITGMGNYTGEIQKTFMIKAMPLSADMAEEIADVVYNGGKQTTGSGVGLAIINPNTGAALTEGTDYMVAYSANQNAGTAKLTVSGKGDYSGKFTTTFRILKASIGDGSFEVPETVELVLGGRPEGYEAVYTGKAIKPAVSITVNGRKLKSTDYSVSYADNKEASDKACVIVKGKGNYEGSVKQYFTILPKPEAPVKLTSSMVSLESTMLRTTGDIIVPGVCVVWGNEILTEAEDYTITYVNANKETVSELTQAGIYQIKVKGIGNYTGEVSKKLTIIDAEKKLIGSEYTNVSLSGGNTYAYTGAAVKPALTVRDHFFDGQELKGGVDYTVSYSNNTKAGVARYTVKGKGKYGGTLTGTFRIVPADMGVLVQEQEGSPIEEQDITISLNKYAFPYNGKAQKPSVTVKYRSKKLKAGTDYEIDYSAIGAPENAVEKKNADTYRISLTFKGNYTGSASLCYAITPVETSKLKVSVPAQKYNGEAICPDLSEMTVKLGSVKLDAQALHGLTLSDWTNHVNVSQSKSKAGVILLAGEDSVNFVKNTQKELTFSISAKAVSDKSLSYTIGGEAVTGSDSGLVLIYNGTPYNGANGADVVITDTVSGKVLREGTDYSLKYSANQNVGTAKVTVKGLGGYKGSKTIKFKIAGKPIGAGTAYSGYELSLELPDTGKFVYTGKAITPKVTVSENNVPLKKNTDYTVKYSNNINAGTAEVIITGKGKYAGTIRQSYSIAQKTKKDAKTISVGSIKEQKYTGSTIFPPVKVKVDGKTLKKGKDYTISVLNSTRLTFEEKGVQKGIATVMITGTGNYKGVLAKKTFMVVKEAE